MRKLFGGLMAGILALAVAVPAMAAPLAPKSSSTIVDIVLADDGAFDVLEAAVIEAGLAGALSRTDVQRTVFAPTDAAFVGTFRALLKDQSLNEADVIAFIKTGGVDKALGDGALADILLFHVTNGRRTSKSVLAAPGYAMLNGDRLSRTELLDAGIAATNIGASNGVIHVIDSVLLP